MTTPKKLILARSWGDVLRVYCFPLELGLIGVGGEGGLGGFEELFVVAVGEVRFVVGAAGFIA